MESNPGFLQVDFQLPNHSNELSRAEEVLEKLKLRFEKLQKANTIDDQVHTAMYEEVIRVLDYVGHLSMPAFEIEDQLKAMYDKQYLSAPELAKQLWLDHYEHLHHPYSLLKNRCFRLLEDLDEHYISIWKKNPANWNP